MKKSNRIMDVKLRRKKKQSEIEKCGGAGVKKAGLATGFFGLVSMEFTYNAPQHFNTLAILY